MIRLYILSVSIFFACISCSSSKLKCNNYDNSLLVIDNIEIRDSIKYGFKLSKDNFKNIINGEKLSSFNPLYHRHVKLSYDDFKEIEMISGFNSSTDDSWDDFQELFLSMNNLYHLGFYEDYGCRIHIIYQDFPSKSNSSKNKSIYLIGENGQNSWVLFSFLYLEEGMESEIVSSTKFVDGYFQYKDYSNKNTYCVYFNITADCDVIIRDTN